MRVHFKKITVIGLGLIGGSLALGIKKAGLADTVLGVDREGGPLSLAASRGVVDAYTTDLIEGVEGAELIVLAVPVGSAEGVIRQVLPKLPARCLVTDVGSTKEGLVRAMEKILPETALFVGGHPITGKEKSGVQAASQDLFSGAKCVLTPTPQTDRQALEQIKALWEAVGSDVVLMEPAEHDRIFAAVSHLPHLAAYALVSAVLDFGDRGGAPLSFSAGGLRDFTRIAASSSEMWRDVCLSNRDHILSAIKVYQEALERIKEFIKNGDGAALYREFEKAKKAREERMP